MARGARRRRLRGARKMLQSTRANLAGMQSCYLCGSAAPLPHRARLAPGHARPPAAVIAMAKPSKAADMRGLSEEEINAEVYKCKRALFDLRVAQKTRQASARWTPAWRRTCAGHPAQHCSSCGWLQQCELLARYRAHLCKGRGDRLEACALAALCSGIQAGSHSKRPAS